jgi:hypothetical protein
MLGARRLEIQAIKYLFLLNLWIAPHFEALLFVSLFDVELIFDSCAGLPVDRLAAGVLYFLD